MPETNRKKSVISQLRAIKRTMKGSWASSALADTIIKIENFENEQLQQLIQFADGAHFDIEANDMEKEAKKPDPELKKIETLLEKLRKIENN